MDKDFTTIEGVFQCESDMAICIEIDSVSLWIPKSLCDDAWECCDRGDEVELDVETWFAEREGLL